MTALPHAHQIRRKAALRSAAEDTITLGYDARMLRRKRLVSDGGLAFIVDLAETLSLEAGDCFALTDGRHVEIRAAAEPVLAITGDLPRLAWHIGNRHTPCQIEAQRLLIRADHVLAAMLRQLGAGVEEVVEPFTPEGGAYGHGRTMGHDHGHDEGARFGWHDHGDGQPHYHPPAPDKPPFGHAKAT
jgi:urease accessory protein